MQEQQQKLTLNVAICLVIKKFKLFVVQKCWVDKKKTVRCRKNSWKRKFQSFSKATTKCLCSIKDNLAGALMDAEKFPSPAKIYNFHTHLSVVLLTDSDVQTPQPKNSSETFGSPAF